MSQALKQKLKSFRNSASPLNPDALWVSANRERLLRQTRNTTGNQKQSFSFTWNSWKQVGNIFFPAKTLSVMRSMVSVVLVGVLTIGSWIASVSASYNSLPGEPLYQVKLATEKTELLVATVIGSDTEKVNTLLKHASHRVEEYKNSKSSSQATEALHSLNTTIKTTNDTLNQVNKNTPDKAIQVAQAVNKKTEKILQSLGEVKGDNAVHVAAMPLNHEVTESSNLVEAAGVRAVEVLIEKNSEDGKAEVEKKFDKVITDFAQINKDANLLSSSTTVSTSLVVSVPSLIAGSASSIATTTPPQTTGEKVDEINKAADKTVAEVKDLLEKNDLLGAIKKVQELQVAKGEVKNVVDTVKNALPVVPAPEFKVPVVSASTTTGTPPISKSPVTVTGTKQ